MPASAEFVQRVVHALETGQGLAWVKRGLSLLIIIGIVVTFTYNFRGLATSQAMDQAQIGRSLASGHGWRTLYVRPLSVGQLQRNGRDVARQIWFDTYNAPLPPLVDAIALFPAKSRLAPNPRNIVYTGDRLIVFMAMLLLLGSIVIQFFTAWRLFDRRLALLACALVLFCDTLWQYSISGLPQMLLLFLFNGTLYVLVRALEAKYHGGAVGPWLAAVGAGFGLLALTHGLTIWMFVPALIFMAFFFEPRGWAAALVLAVFLLLYLPWLVRTWLVCGNPTGLALFSVLDGLGRSEAGWMRQMSVYVEGLGPAALRDKMTANVILQLGRIFEYLGWSVAAAAFFVSLLHFFKRAETAILRWMLLAMWVGAVLGMATFGLKEEQSYSANQLHLLFIPLMTCYGLAWLLVQWNRLDIPIRLARIGFLTLLFILVVFPMGNSLYNMLFGRPQVPLRWPPYAPSLIANLNTWMGPGEITASDMPWAVAWYAGRPSILLPETVQAMTDLSDYGSLGSPIMSVYLTPVSGDENKLHDITKGEYSSWSALILQTADLSKFPFKWGSFELGYDKGCIFLSDRDRHPKETP
jgi:hypothetical protein